jgi:hypothetical protein
VLIENISNSSEIYNPINLSFNNLGSLSPKAVEINLVSYGFDSNGDRIVYSDNSTILNQSITVFLECYTVSDGVYVANCVNDPDPSNFFWWFWWWKWKNNADFCFRKNKLFS